MSRGLRVKLSLLVALYFAALLAPAWAVKLDLPVISGNDIVILIETGARLASYDGGITHA